MTKPSYAIGIRQLVEFSIFAEDLMPGGSALRMVEGSRAHRARQKSALEQDYRAEVSLSIEVEGENLGLVISGRADALFDQDGLLVVEEIKLTPLSMPSLSAPLPEHLAQAMCYGHILCVQEGHQEILLRVLYVHGDGSQAGVFEELWSAARLAEGFGRLVVPMMAWQEQRQAHREKRDKSLGALAFPHDTYRAGQREFSAQVYYAIRLQKRLLAQAPTGTGKTLATLFPALKALGEGKTGQIFYLTARTTGRGLALATLSRLLGGGGHFFAMELTAKEKACVYPGRKCHPEECPLAKGFYVRLPEGIQAMQGEALWDRETIARVAGQHDLCPFEFSLSLAEIADVVVCDYNYAFDPIARLRRVFLYRRDLTLLVDEAHHLVDRARGMYSAELPGALVREMRRDYGKARGRKNAVYRKLTDLLKALDARREPMEEPEESQAEAPEELAKAAMEAGEAMSAVEPIAHASWIELMLGLMRFASVAGSFDETYATLYERRGKALTVRLFCMDPAPKIEEITRRLLGTVYFSATLSPLAGYAQLLGLAEGDARLALPSPFPAEHLMVLRRRVNTRYRFREGSAEQIARDAAAVVGARPGNYLMMFPSYAYLRLVREQLEAAAPDLRLLSQHGQMDEAARDAFLAEFSPGGESLLGLVVMGGIFSEGIDLPGDQLSGVIVVGIGLPQVCLEREVLRAYFQRTVGDGFTYAYRIPGLTKVVQAAGRVIRTETDIGVVLLLDDRFFTGEVECLLPVHWQKQDAWDVPGQVGRFWEGMGNTVLFMGEKYQKP